MKNEDKLVLIKAYLAKIKTNLNSKRGPQTLHRLKRKLGGTIEPKQRR